MLRSNVLVTRVAWLAPPGAFPRGPWSRWTAWPAWYAGCADMGRAIELLACGRKKAFYPKVLAIWIVEKGKPLTVPRLFALDFVTTGDYHNGMKAVGVKQLKARLSEYLRLVRAGETVLVTDRDEVIAELRPARRERPVSDDVQEILDALAEAGEVTRASTAKAGWTWNVRGLGLPPGTARALLDQVRADRG